MGVLVTHMRNSHVCSPNTHVYARNTHICLFSGNTHMCLFCDNILVRQLGSVRGTHICVSKTHVRSRNARVCFQNAHHMCEWRNAGMAKEKGPWPQQDVPGVNDPTGEAPGGLESADLKHHARPPPGLLRHRWVVSTAKRRRRPTVRCLKGGSSVTPHLRGCFAQARGRLGAGPGNGLLRTPQARGAWE